MASKIEFEHKMSTDTIEYEKKRMPIKERDRHALLWCFESEIKIFDQNRHVLIEFNEACLLGMAAELNFALSQLELNDDTESSKEIHDYYDNYHIYLKKRKDVLIFKEEYEEVNFELELNEFKKAIQVWFEKIDSEFNEYFPEIDENKEYSAIKKEILT